MRGCHTCGRLRVSCPAFRNGRRYTAIQWIKNTGHPYPRLKA